VHDEPAPTRNGPRWSAGSRVFAWGTRWRAHFRRAPLRRVAIATCDGFTLNATYQAASSFVLYEQTDTALEYAGLLAGSFTDPQGWSESELQQGALSDQDLIFVLDEGSGSPGTDASSGPQIVRCSSARPIEELVRELELSLDGRCTR
jgi:hypothetical protein